MPSPLSVTRETQADAMRQYAASVEPLARETPEQWGWFYYVRTLP
jgi:lauroyl/myristoyl acyltransferase